MIIQFLQALSTPSLTTLVPLGQGLFFYDKPIFIRRKGLRGPEKRGQDQKEILRGPNSSLDKSLIGWRLVKF